MKKVGGGGGGERQLEGKRDFMGGEQDIVYAIKGTSCKIMCVQKGEVFIKGGTKNQLPDILQF